MTPSVSDTPAHDVIASPRRRRFLHESPRDRVLGFLWRFARVILFHPTFSFCNWWRVLCLRMFGATVGKRVRIAASATIFYPWNLTIEDDVFIAHGVILNAMAPIHIGSHTRLSQYAHVVSGTHDYTQRDMRIVRKPVSIGKNVWIAADAFVGPGVTIGDDAVLGARSSAFKNLPGGFVYRGEPARPHQPVGEQGEKVTEG